MYDVICSNNYEAWDNAAGFILVYAIYCTGANIQMKYNLFYVLRCMHMPSNLLIKIILYKH